MFGQNRNTLVQNQRGKLPRYQFTNIPHFRFGANNELKNSYCNKDNSIMQMFFPCDF